MASSEESPLLAPDALSPNPRDHESVYERFSPVYKRVILGLVSWCAVMPYFITGTFYPSIPQIARDLRTTGQDVSIAVSVSVFSISVGSLIAASYSTFYGRRRVYLISLPFSIIGSFGVASARNMPELLFWRIWQCAGASLGRAVGAGVIGDIYRLEERGTGMGIFIAGSLIGPAVAPPIGGLVAHYVSWRFMQTCIGFAQLFSFILFFLAFPETSHPGARGIDKLRLTGNTRNSWKHVNPLQPIDLLRSPVIAVAVCFMESCRSSFAGFFTLLTDFTLLVPLPYTIAKRYHLDGNEGLVGACYLPCGIGNIVGAITTGRYSDKIVTYWKKKRNGTWYPEDRLRATFPGGLLFCPLSVLGCGLVTYYIEGRIGLGLNLILLFFNGVGVTMVLSTISAYVVDIVHSRSAEAVACSTAFRQFVLTFAIAVLMPMINNYGVLVTNTIVSLLAWVGFVLLVLNVHYGDQMRAWTDVEYSTEDNN
ncbi:hypothetical protein AN958_09356 [Leucoagaricus sp. SymC.cos]|nr:hypothetical protein AN958_09356 [Leucoagaricus sp. SymC.cos]